MEDPEEIIKARKIAEDGFKYFKKGNLDKSCPLLTKALSIFMKYVNKKGRFKYPKETAKLLCSLPYGCTQKATQGECK
ncbi:MAG: hypothetical protein ACTSYR_00080 [Candidatus Odinarchaeia archaeon]